MLEGILLAVGPVGAGINLELLHWPVRGDGGSQQRSGTGLPRQMIEIHEPLRLQIVVEASTEVLTAIYQRQPSLRELIGGDWVHDRQGP
ncbi:MAG: putative inorganic carbon transporter subunit DabA [Candidatus Competibacteraceae bacterium]